tara:strand:- start:434 stop:1096 length:663 start_codon:yes stop_codon:yes gene_type:complete
MFRNIEHNMKVSEYIKQFPVFWINMDSATERREQMEQRLEELGLNHIRVSGVACSTVIEGCAKSQLSILENNKPPFIILEDDCGIIPESLNNKISDLYASNMDCLYLGISSWAMATLDQKNYLTSRMTEPTHCEPTANPNIMKIHHMLSTHAILYLTQSYIDAVIKEIKKYQQLNWHCDVACAEIQKQHNVHALNPPLFFQDEPINRPITKIKIRLNQAN